MQPQTQNIDLTKMSAVELTNLLTAAQAQLAANDAQAKLIVANAKVQADRLEKQNAGLTANVVAIQSAIDALNNPAPTA